MKPLTTAASSTLQMAKVLYLYYLSKVLEWIDTVRTPHEALVTPRHLY
jgi:hypothetical protein